MASSFRVVEHVVNGCHTRDYVGATARGDADIPKLSVKQYIPVDNPNPKPGDVTIIAAHANGFPKELYEPLWDEMHKRASQTRLRIRSIWIADMWNQGQSGVLNENILGSDRFHALPYQWNWTHSLLSLSHPRLLRSLILLDPVIQVPNGSVLPALASTPRRDIWPSRREAADRFRGSKFFQAWDPRVLDRWIEYGLRQLPTELHPSQDHDERVTLTTTKHQELLNFLRPTYRGIPREEYVDKDSSTDEEFPGYPFYRPEPLQVFQRLPEIRPSVLYVFGEKSELSPSAQRRAKMERTGTGVGGSGGIAAGRVKEVVLDCGHLVAMERVEQCADTITEFLDVELERWREEKVEYDKYWNEKTRKEQITIDDKWAERVNPDRQVGKTKL
ncbi:hypothetical protein FSARC_13474 [Fusarium sarcochroum]|uniref:Toxin biosynthesis protein n=1 Tax=Fusarium sarcochroum TaxID=1208366 RepID=A0A8H4T163_9HYPO|nr:hypothetical protein FSARC_13474 [Fusarium sarcochroum]